MYSFIRRNNGGGRDIVNRPTLAECTREELHELAGDGRLTPLAVEAELRRREALATAMDASPSRWKGPR